MQEDLDKLKGNYAKLIEEKRALEEELKKKQTEIEALNGRLSDQNDVIQKLQQDIDQLTRDIQQKDLSIEELYKELQDKIKALEECNNKLEDKLDQTLDDIVEEPSGDFGVLSGKIGLILKSIIPFVLQLLFYVLIRLGGSIVFRRLFNNKTQPPGTGGTTDNQPDPGTPPPTTGLCDALLDAWQQFEDRLFERLDRWMEDKAPVEPSPIPMPPPPLPPDPDPEPEPPTNPSYPDNPEAPPSHPDYIEPPGVVIPPQYEPDGGRPLYPKVPSPYVPRRTHNVEEHVNSEDLKSVTGYGPVPPNMPATQYNANEVLAAVDELSRRHSMDDRLSTVSQLVRQILHEPKRKLKGD
jgi:Skp family chaperone for outer membrane proteins